MIGNLKPQIGIDRDQSGAAALEFALVLPMLLLILFAIIEYGWYFTNRIVLANAVSTAARAAFKAREWEGESPVAFAEKAFKAACWIADAENVNIVSDTTAIGTTQPGQVFLTLAVDDGTPRTVAVVAMMGYRSLTGFLPRSGPDSQEGVGLLPSAVAAKSVMVYP